MRLLFFIFCIFQTTFGSKILFIAPSLSNSIVLQAGRLADLLVLDGHNVTFFIPELVSINKLNGTSLAKVIRMGGFQDRFLESLRDLGDLFDPSINSIYARFKIVYSQTQFCNDLLERIHELDELKRENFDLVISNQLDYCDVGLAHYFEPRGFAWMVTGPLHENNNYVLGVPAMPSYLPTLEDSEVGTDMTFAERVFNFLNWIQSTALHRFVSWRVTRLFRKHISSDFPDVNALAAQSSLVFVNNDEFLDFARPILHKVVYIGGAGLKKPKPLNDYFENIMYKGAKGVVLVSFGTAVYTPALRPSKVKEMLAAFAEYPEYHFLMKVSGDDNTTALLAKGVPNIEFISWMPQSDILAHPNLKAFISHGGYNSALESALRGVPIIVLPFFFDHFRNGKMLEHRDMGISISKTDFGEASLKRALKEVLYNPKYEAAAKRMKNLMTSKPNQPDETFLKWTNFLLQHGSLPELTPAGAKMNLVTYLSLDVIAFILSCVLACLWISKKLFTYVFLSSLKIKSKVE